MSDEKLLGNYSATGFIERIKRRGGFKAYRCPICGHDKFLASDDVVSLKAMNGLSLLASTESVIPSVIVTCGNCGHMDFFNIQDMSILFPEAAKEDVVTHD